MRVAQCAICSPHASASSPDSATPSPGTRGWTPAASHSASIDSQPSSAPIGGRSTASGYHFSGRGDIDGAHADPSDVARGVAATSRLLVSRAPGLRSALRVGRAAAPGARPLAAAESHSMPPSSPWEPYPPPHSSSDIPGFSSTSPARRRRRRHMPARRRLTRGGRRPWRVRAWSGGSGGLAPGSSLWP